MDADDVRTKQFRKQYKQATKTVESRFDLDQQRIVTDHVARCGVLLTLDSKPVFYAHDNGPIAKLTIAEHLKKYAKRCADPTFGELFHEYFDDLLLPTQDPGALFKWLRTSNLYPDECEPYGTYAISLYKAAAVKGVANGAHRNSYGYLMTLDDLPGWLEDAFAVCKPTLPPVTKRMDAALCAYRIAGGAVKDPLMAYFEAQAKQPQTFGSLFARQFPSATPTPPPPAQKPLVVLVIRLDDKCVSGFARRVQEDE